MFTFILCNFLAVMYFFKKNQVSFAPENMKKTPSKVAHNQPQFYFQYWPGCPNQPGIDFSYNINISPKTHLSTDLWVECLKSQVFAGL